MARTLSTFLESVNMGTYDPYLAVVYDTVPTTNVFSFKISQHEIEAYVADDISDIDYLQVERGAYNNGVADYIRTAKYFVTDLRHGERGTKVKASLIPPRPFTVVADGTYAETIALICTALGVGCEFKNPTADFWGYQFMPTGTTLHTDDGRSIISLLKQKYLIDVCEGGASEVTSVLRFFQYDNYPAGFTGDISLTEGVDNYLVDPWYLVDKEAKRNFIWHDAAGNNYTAGNESLYPAHNLGFLDTSDVGDLPPYSENIPGLECKDLAVDWRLQNGDKIYVHHGFSVVVAEVDECFKAERSDGPAYWMDVRTKRMFSNTAGGFVQSVLNVPYTPLDTTNFTE